MGKQLQEEGFTLVSLDESFFFYDSLVRRVWIDEKKRPVVRVTGSHKHSCIVWSHKSGRKAAVQTVPINSTVIPFLDFLKIIHS